MKRILVLLMVFAMSISLLAGCSKEPEVEVDSTEELIGQIEEAEDTVPEGMARSYLTGEWVDEELATQRPIAVMFGNTTAALPQYGIGSAEIVYESPVEGGLTRILAVIQDYENVEKIMSVRSCRHYFVHWALEYDAIYTHYGQAYLAESLLGEDYVDNLNGMVSSVDNVVYQRDSSRKAPHNAFTTGEKVAAGIEFMEYDTQLNEDYDGHFIFNEDDDNEIQLTNGTDASVVTPGYPINKPWFEYNEEDGLYYRYQHGAAQIDAVDNSSLSCKNIILQVCDWYVMDESAGYLDVNTTSGGNGYYITNGKMVPITWEKESITAVTHYYLEDGTEITLNQGKTWVCIIQNTYEDRVTFE